LEPGIEDGRGVVCGSGEYIRVGSRACHKAVYIDLTFKHSSNIKMLFSTVVLPTALLAAGAAAHGAVTSYVIDGVKYPG
jgi:hypothetical protein